MFLNKEKEVSQLFNYYQLIDVDTIFHKMISYPKLLEIKPQHKYQIYKMRIYDLLWKGKILEAISFYNTAFRIWSLNNSKYKLNCESFLSLFILMIDNNDIPTIMNKYFYFLKIQFLNDTIKIFNEILDSKNTLLLVKSEFPNIIPCLVFEDIDYSLSEEEKRLFNELKNLKSKIDKKRRLEKNNDINNTKNSLDNCESRYKGHKAILKKEVNDQKEFKELSLIESRSNTDNEYNNLKVDDINKDDYEIKRLHNKSLDFLEKFEKEAEFLQIIPESDFFNLIENTLNENKTVISNHDDINAEVINNLSDKRIKREVDDVKDSSADTKHSDCDIDILLNHKRQKSKDINTINSTSTTNATINELKYFSIDSKFLNKNTFKYVVITPNKDLFLKINKDLKYNQYNHSIITKNKPQQNKISSRFSHSHAFLHNFKPDFMKKENLDIKIIRTFNKFVNMFFYDRGICDLHFIKKTNDKKENNRSNSKDNFNNISTVGNANALRSDSKSNISYISKIVDLYDTNLDNEEESDDSRKIKQNIANIARSNINNDCTSNKDYKFNINTNIDSNKRKYYNSVDISLFTIPSPQLIKENINKVDNSINYKIKSGLFDKDSIFSLLQKAFLFAVKKYYPPFKYNGEMFKTINIKYILWLFEDNFIKKMYKDFTSELFDKFIDSIVKEHNLNRECEMLEKLKYYVMNFCDIYSKDKVEISKEIEALFIIMNTIGVKDSKINNKLDIVLDGACNRKGSMRERLLSYDDNNIVKDIKKTNKKNSKKEEIKVNDNNISKLDSKDSSINVLSSGINSGYCNKTDVNMKIKKVNYSKKSKLSSENIYYSGEGENMRNKGRTYSIKNKSIKQINTCKTENSIKNCINSDNINSKYNDYCINLGCTNFAKDPCNNKSSLLSEIEHDDFFNKRRTTSVLYSNTQLFENIKNFVYEDNFNINNYQINDYQQTYNTTLNELEEIDNDEEKLINQNIISNSNDDMNIGI